MFRRSNLRIVAITRGAPPISQMITVGSAIRAFNFLSHFKKSGFECFFVSGGNELQGVDRVIDGMNIVPFFADREIPNILDAIQPDFILINVSELVQYIPENTRSFVILDLFAHRFLEAFYERVDITTDLFLRLDILRRADYFIVQNSRQRDFVYSLLMLSGIQDCISRVLTVPHIATGIQIERKIQEGPIFIAGGYHWPWADDLEYIDTLVRILEEQGNGVLRIYGGRFAIDSRADEVERKYRKSPRTMEMGVMPYDALLRSYSEASAGIVCFSPNLERHFSFNFRAADYLSCGVPIIVNDYMPISELVKRYDAGWVIKGLSDFEDVARKVMSDNESLTHKSDNAMILSAQEFAPSRYMETLLNMLKSPSKKTTRENLIGGLIRIVDRYVKEGIENSDMLREIKKLEAENIRLSERLVTRDSEILRLNNEKTEMLRKSGWLSDEVKRLSDEVSRLRDEILRLRNEKDRLDKEIAEANAKITELYRENGFLKDENVRLMGEKNSRDDDIIRLKNEIIEMKKAILNLESEIQKRDTMIGELRKKEAELEGIKSLPMYRLYKKVF